MENAFEVDMSDAREPTDDELVAEVLGLPIGDVRPLSYYTVLDLAQRLRTRDMELKAANVRSEKYAATLCEVRRLAQPVANYSLPCSRILAVLDKNERPQDTQAWQRMRAHMRRKGLSRR